VSSIPVPVSVAGPEKKIIQAQYASKIAIKIWEKLTNSTQYKWSSLGFCTV